MLELLGQSIFHFLRHYGYAIMLPLMIIEGPVVTLLSAMMASLGAFNVWIVLLFSILGDLIGDSILYALGYHYGIGFVRNVGKYFGITETLVGRMERYFARHGQKTIFLVKSTTGLCWATFTAAGIVKMDFRKFIRNAFLGGVVWSSFLVAMGYFYGYLWRQIRDDIKYIGWVVFAIAIVTFIIINIYKSRRARKLLAENGNDK